VDGSGAVFVAGSTNGAIEAGSTNTGGPNLLAARYDAAGTLAWLHQRGSGAATNDNALGVAADAFGGLFLGGITSGGLDGNVSAGGFDAYLVKYGVDGTPR
jgi:hypothetical protein